MADSQNQDRRFVRRRTSARSSSLARIAARTTSPREQEGTSPCASPIGAAHRAISLARGRRRCAGRRSRLPKSPGARPAPIVTTTSGRRAHRRRSHTRGHLLLICTSSAGWCDVKRVGSPRPGVFEGKQQVIAAGDVLGLARRATGAMPTWRFTAHWSSAASASRWKVRRSAAGRSALDRASGGGDGRRSGARA